MEVLIVATIVGILVTVGTVQYLEVKRRAKEHYCAQRLGQLAVYENMYFKEFGEYTDKWNAGSSGDSFSSLTEEGYIDEQYLYQSDELQHYKRPAYIQEYLLEFVIDENQNGFQIIATPVVNEVHLWYPRWTPLGGIDDLRSMFVEQDGVVRYLDSGRPVF